MENRYNILYSCICNEDEFLVLITHTHTQHCLKPFRIIHLYVYIRLNCFMSRFYMFFFSLLYLFVGVLCSCFGIIYAIEIRQCFVASVLIVTTMLKRKKKRNIKKKKKKLYCISTLRIWFKNK